ncbi:MAG TPA: hypothetical protein DEA55_08015 [Rhodospirillaceae bacterium]|nr:hypothetical protein [Rhodospirillaceae bacterium]
MNNSHARCAKPIRQVSGVWLSRDNAGWLALSAQPQKALRLVIGQGWKLTGLGVLLGLFGALALTRWLKTLLFEVSATDPLTFVVIALLLTCVALMACWIPALRATKVDPVGCAAGGVGIKGTWLGIPERPQRKASGVNRGYGQQKLL